MSYSLTLAGIALANLLAIISPGPAFLLVSRTAASRSRALGLATGLGVAAATTLWAVAATFGVAVLMTRLTTLYGLVQLVGGAYLIWLGLSAWRDHGDAPSGTASAAAALGGTPSAMELRRAFLTGLSLTLTNPKVVVFCSRPRRPSGCALRRSASSRCRRTPGTCSSPAFSPRRACRRPISASRAASTASWGRYSSPSAPALSPSRGSEIRAAMA